jgi:hypothetical protein
MFNFQQMSAVLRKRIFTLVKIAGNFFANRKIFARLPFIPPDFN